MKAIENIMISWESITTITAPKNRFTSTWTDGLGSVNWNQTTCPLIFTLKVKTRTRGRRGSRRCPPWNAFPLLIFQPSSAHGGESAGHRRTVLWSVELLASRYAAASGSSVPAAKKASNCWIHWCCQLYLQRVKFQSDCTWVKTVLHSKNLVILSCSKRFCEKTDS